jgi:hypothetical protein
VARPVADDKVFHVLYNVNHRGINNIDTVHLLLLTDDIDEDSTYPVRVLTSHDPIDHFEFIVVSCGKNITILTYRIIQSIINRALVLGETCSFQYILLHAYIAISPPINEYLPVSNTAALPMYAKLPRWR